jgi:hypothetical protein
VFANSRLLQLSLLFVGNDTNLPLNGAPERFFRLVGPGFPIIHYTRLEKPVSNKQTSFLGPIQSYEENKVL